ncbi:hypothetical protein HanHA300_Chr12g0461571 [Helianthus annuus]|nr:hypothetical protein HanHA300_Chr12g0461571 [Helianthus annuus]KAJ0506869.1 hypothetical protein HanHA89_Chr12g0486971 [Helianthus annuus]
MNRAMSASSKSRLCSLFRSDALHKDPRGYIVRRFSLLVNDSGHESGDSNGRTGVKGLAKDLRFVERCEATALFHSELLLPILYEKVVMILVKSMKNPRSA